MIYLDTSALIKLYLLEEGSVEVNNLVMGQDEPLPVWELQEMELFNAMRLKVFRKEITSKNAEDQLKLFALRRQRGFYYFPEIDRTKLSGGFMRLSQENTPKLGCRTLDILHVACAEILAADRFVTGDQRQHDLAVKVGLKSTFVS